MRVDKGTTLCRFLCRYCRVPNCALPSWSVRGGLMMLFLRHGPVMCLFLWGAPRTYGERWLDFGCVYQQGAAHLFCCALFLLPVDV
jgi:hypothetical protein